VRVPAIMLAISASVLACAGPGGGVAPTLQNGQPIPTFPPAANGQPMPTLPPPNAWQPIPTFPPPDAPQPLPTFLPPDIGQPLPTFPPDNGQPITPLPQPGGSAAMPVRLTPLAIWDPAAGNVPAVTFLTPAGWQAEGNVLWTHQWSRVAQLQTRIADPSTGIVIEWLPLQDFIWFQPPAGLEVPIGGNYQGKAFVPPVTDPAQFVRDFWMPGQLAHLQGASLVAINEVPSVAAAFRESYGGPADAFAYRLRYEFQHNGQVWEEDVFLALLYAGSAELTSWYVNFAYSVRAPKGQIDLNHGIISTVIASRTTTPEWEGTYRLVTQLFRQGIAQQMADTVAFGETLARYRAESQALQQQVTDERNASQDRIAALRRDSLGGVQNYVNPFNQIVVQLPIGWETYWTNAQGEYLIAPAGADLNEISSIWQQLQPQR